MAQSDSVFNDNEIYNVSYSFVVYIRSFAEYFIITDNTKWNYCVIPKWRNWAYGLSGKMYLNGCVQQVMHNGILLLFLCEQWNLLCYQYHYVLIRDHCSIDVLLFCKIKMTIILFCVEDELQKNKNHKKHR